ncbi:uncharacterized protein BCR38DRAFT_180712 [Pseudomassariella vexata]|uniref:RING-type domain-containing protein n=1 Tax=Pseudomassariella vexata TaxID=1141098 RepID=A0A1Y2E4H6_9PEZI|nr:uncharacterized protein BCR38DRAFT_180712 [Pseudomassariella vexata]ORY66460.1 hypothetical protein BCR38DRAFT_180712 [Pseudomassariella vexata]
MDPAAMDFVMHSSSPDRAGLTPMDIDQQQQQQQQQPQSFSSPCPGSHTAEPSRHPGMHPGPRGGGGTYAYDPVHASSPGASWWPPQYHHHNNNPHQSWQHPTLAPYPRSGPNFYSPSYPPITGPGPGLPQSNPGSQPHYPPMNGQENYNPHAHAHLHMPSYYPGPMMPNLPRIGGPPPTQSQSGFFGGAGDSHAGRAGGLPSLSSNPAPRQTTSMPQPRSLNRHSVHNVEPPSPTRQEPRGHSGGRTIEGEHAQLALRPTLGTPSSTFAAPEFMPRRESSAAALGRSRTAASSSEPSSDEEADPNDPEAVTMRRMIEAGLLPPSLTGPEETIRQQQLLRGSLPTRRVASRSAISSLQSVTIQDLPESERTCIICYNEFGIENPEGINEAPLRLPRCKHVFGDHCIKKWFEESDSCPYCRDKVPSEPQFRQQRHHMMGFMGRHAHLTMHAIPRPQPGSPGESYQVPSYRPRDTHRAAWHASPERRSPTGRRRHTSLRGSPPSVRPTSSYISSTTPGQPYYNLPQLSSTLDRDQLPFLMGVPAGQYPNPLHSMNSGSSTNAADPFRPNWPQA